MMNRIGSRKRLSSQKLWAVLVTTLLVGSSAQLLRAGLNPANVTQSDIQISYQASGDEPAVTYTLGSFTASLVNSSYSYGLGQTQDAVTMRSVFTVNTGANAAPTELFEHVQLHWYQNVQSLPLYDPATYLGQYIYTGPSNKKLPITDVPKGGWDYMYTSSARTTVVSGYGIFVDNDPFYYSRTAELNSKDSHGNFYSQPGNQYVIEDQPADRNNNGVVGFSTILVAEVKTNTAIDAMGLLPGQLLVLGGFNWHNSSADLGIDSSFAGVQALTLSDMNTGLGYGGFAAWNASTFSGWTAVAGKTIEVIPEPATISLLVVATGGLLMKRTRRN